MNAIERIKAIEQAGTARHFINYLSLEDHELVEAYEATDGDPKNPEVSRMVEEIRRRGIYV